MAKSVIDQIKALDEQRNKLMEGAKTEAMTAVEAALTNLNALGYSYRITESKGGGSRKGTRTVKDAPCERCGFKTIPPHDLRSHRLHPKAFTDKELAEKGWQKA